MNLAFCDVGLHLYHFNNINTGMHLFKMNFIPIFNKYQDQITHPQPYLNLNWPGGFAIHSAKQHRPRALTFTTDFYHKAEIHVNMWKIMKSDAV